MKRSFAAVLVFLAVAAACGDGEPGSTPTTTLGTTSTLPSPTTGPPATTEPPPSVTTQPPLPVDPNRRLLVVRREGGLVPPEFFLGQLPLYTLFADGRLVYQGATPAIFPGPLLPAVVQIDIGESGIAEVLAAVTAVGLQDITELYNSDAIAQVADGPNTEVTYYDENGEHLFSVYALEIAQQTDPQVLELGELVRLLDRLAATIDATQPFITERLQVIAREQAPNVDDPSVVVTNWPLAIPPEQMPDADFALRCAVVDVAADPGSLLVLQEAHQLTFFEFGSATYRLTVRPLLTGEPGCESRR